MRNYNRKNRKSESGQTLLLGVISLVVILLAALVFFDIQNMLRGKVKGQNAADAAAIAGANWQMHSLNLIGELNLVKAATVMISDSSPFFGIGTTPEEYMQYPAAEELDTEEKIKAEIQRVHQEKIRLQSVADLLTEMQTRISFVGPLIGFGAAQQAAKNNGIQANTGVGNIFKKNFVDLIGEDNLYGNENLAPQIINNYAWRAPYQNMLNAIVDANDGNAWGIAAMPRFEYLGAPQVSFKDDNPLYPYLVQRSFYTAVNGNNWCALITFLDSTDQMELDTSWWRGMECTYNPSFIGESEVLPLHIDFSQNQEVRYGEKIQAVLDVLAEKRNLTLTDKVFDRQEPYHYTADETGNVVSFNPDRNPDDTDSRSVLPEINWAVFDNYWSKYDPANVEYWEIYLSGKFKPGLDYTSGALSYFEIAQYVPTYTGRHNIAGSFRGIGDASGKNGLGRDMHEYGKAAAASGNSMKNLSTPVNATASAKPMGTLPGGLSPHEVSMILPVFTNSALIPVALEPPPGISMIDVAWFYYLSEFIPLLHEATSLPDAMNRAEKQYPDHVHYYQFFYKALLKINNPDWIRQGKEWLDTPLAYQVDEYGKRVKDQNGKDIVIKRRRDTCNDWPDKDCSCSNCGPRRGPGALH